MKHLRLIVVAAILLLIAAGVFAYVSYRSLPDAGVSTDLRHGQPCDQSSKDPCPAP